MRVCYIVSYAYVMTYECEMLFEVYLCLTIAGEEEYVFLQSRLECFRWGVLVTDLRKIFTGCIDLCLGNKV